MPSSNISSTNKANWEYSIHVNVAVLQFRNIRSNGYVTNNPKYASLIASRIIDCIALMASA